MTNTAHQILYVAALTYKRPGMLADLLQALSALEHPAGWTVCFLIVDNDADASAHSIVESFAPMFREGQLVYVIEPEPGIPAARNRALDEAVASDAKLLAFLDDDEYPDPYWLRALVEHQSKTGAVLTGGPMRIDEPNYPVSTWQRFILRSLIDRAAFRESYCARVSRNGKVPNIATNNWLGDVQWIKESGLRFDPAHRYSGGSDSTFFLATRAAGGKTSWCPDAIVYEHMLPERLSLRYQLSRYRTYGINRTKRGGSRLRISVEQIASMTAGAALVVVPIFGRASFMIGIQLVATGAGWFAGLAGARSSRYSRSEATKVEHDQISARGGQSARYDV